MFFASKASFVYRIRSVSDSNERIVHRLRIVYNNAIFTNNCQPHSISKISPAGDRDDG